MKNISNKLIIDITNGLSILLVTSLVTGLIMLLISSQETSSIRFSTAEINRFNQTLESLRPIENAYSPEIEKLLLEIREKLPDENSFTKLNATLTWDYSPLFYYSEDSGYVLNRVDDIKVTNEVINKLTTIEGEQFTNWYEFRAAIRSQLTEQEFDQYWSILEYWVAKDNNESLAKWGGILVLISLVFLVISISISTTLTRRNIERKRIENVEEIRKKLDGTSIMPSWDMAQITLEQYYDRNLQQINMIFRVSVVVMVAGFMLIAYGILQAINGADINISYISASAGILTEFIGATFIFIYRSVIKQAIEYTTSLEKINTVGMSIKILESVDPDANTEKLADAKIEIAKILIGNNMGNQRQPNS